MPRTLAALSVVLISTLAFTQGPLGIFENHSDVGAVLHPGSATYDPATKTYTLRGSGENMWGASDAFQFAWKKVSGDVELTADVRFPDLGGNAHKKAVLMFRQSLEADSVYADVALHASGLTSLQYRDQKGAATSEVQSKVNNHMQAVAETPGKITIDYTGARLKLSRRGRYVYLSLGGMGSNTAFDGESIRLPFQGEFYAGIGVCSHDKNATEEATFSNVDLKPLPAPTAQPALYSTLETVDIDTAIRHVVYVASGKKLEAPNWSHDGAYFLFNRDGQLEKLSVSAATPTILDTGFARRNNNDHGISPDSTQIAISDQSQSENAQVYLVPIAGGAPRLITKNGPSYWHGWSPDGKTLAFVGQRNGEFDIYTISTQGGDETRITTAKGLDDGPEYSPDGQYIYFNSERTGHMQIWRMKPDGSDQEQVFSDDYNNWFPHISPDGKWMVFLTYERDVTGHPENKDVTLRLVSLADKKITELAKLFGGQGTINVPSWSPDSKHVAFVSFQLIEQ